MELPHNQHDGHDLCNLCINRNLRWKRIQENHFLRVFVTISSVAAWQSPTLSGRNEHGNSMSFIHSCDTISPSTRHHLQVFEKTQPIDLRKKNTRHYVFPFTSTLHFQLKQPICKIMLVKLDPFPKTLTLCGENTVNHMNEQKSTSCICHCEIIIT